MGVNPRRLALEVLNQALVDVVNPKPSHHRAKKQEQQDAKDFLFDPKRRDDLTVWCQNAGVNVDAFIKRALYVVENRIDVTKELERVEHKVAEHKLIEEGAIH